MIGDITKVRDSYGGEHEEYGNYFDDGCHPNLSAVKGVVKSVEAKLNSHLERQALGTPMLQPLSPADILDRITVNQGYFAQGPKETAFDGTIAAIRQMSATRTVQAPAQSEKVNRRSNTCRLRIRSLRREKCILIVPPTSTKLA